MRQARSAVSYGIAVLLSAAAVLLRLALKPAVGDQWPLITIVLAVAASVWMLGYRAAIVTAALGYVAGLYFLVPPDGFGVFTALETIRLLAFAVGSAIVIGFGEAARSAAALRRRARVEESQRAAENLRAQHALRETEARFSRFMQHLPGLAWIKDLEGRYVFANDAALTAFGLDHDQLYGRTDGQIFAADTAAAFESNDRQALATGAGIQTVESLRHPDGVVRSSVVSKFPIPGPDGRTAWVGGMAIDVTEWRRAEEAVREADRRKNAFLATLSHELRNPLAPIRHTIELLKRAGDDRAVRASGLEILERQVHHMVRLVDDLLDLGRISNDRLELRRSRIDLSDVVSQALETCREAQERAGHAITVNLPAEPVYLDADAVRLVQVFGNLINNACKYNPAPGHVEITATRDNGMVTIAVKDDGEGIPKEALDQIFEMFAQGRRGGALSQGSLGIGLALSKRIVELHGGRIRAESDGPGHGSEFVVTLPADDRDTAKEIEPAVHVPESGRGLRVLVVDDNVDSAESLAMLLSFSGHTTATAHDGEEAIALAREFKPEVAILDVGLPTISGLEVCREIRRLPAGKDMFIVALTGWGQEEDRRRSTEAGFDEHFVKPLDHTKLLQRLERLPFVRRETS